MIQSWGLKCWQTKTDVDIFTMEILLAKVVSFHYFFQGGTICLPSGKLSHNYGKPPFFMGKSTISMTIFNSYVKLPEGNQQKL